MEKRGAACVYVYTYIRHVAGITAGGPVVLSAIVFVRASRRVAMLINHLDRPTVFRCYVYVHTYICKYTR